MTGELSRVDNDDRLIDMWLHDRPTGTQANYRRTVAEFNRFTAKGLSDVRLEDLQGYVTHLNDRGLKDATKRNKVNALKSLFSFAAKLQYVRFNVAAALRSRKYKVTLAGRILSREQAIALVSFHPIVIFMYATGVRVSEACGLRWSDIQQLDGRVQARIFGKGNKERVVLVPQAVWQKLQPLRGDRPSTASVFLNNGVAMNRFAAHRIVKAAVAHAGVDPRVSAHWLRHAHAQHSLAAGAPLHLVRDSLGHSSIAVTNIYLESNPDDGSSRYLSF